MKNVRIESYSLVDNKQALDLEGQCIQGKSLALSFVRPTFHARSEVYKNYKIFCAKVDKKLVGIFAAAEKIVTLHNESIRSLYFYDCRIDPLFRHQGIAKKLTKALVEYFGKNIDCYYTLIAGQNKRAFDLASKGFGAEIVIPLTYIIFPVYKKYHLSLKYEKSSVDDIFKIYSQNSRQLEFVPDLNRNFLAGYVGSFADNNLAAASSIWTNENLLSERVEKTPFHFHLYKMFTTIINPLIDMPQIPNKKEILKSWFLFNLYAKNIHSVVNLLKHINNQAIVNRKKFIYVLLQNNDPILSFFRKTKLKHFKLPYYFLGKGSKIPRQNDKIYIDIRDL